MTQYTLATRLVEWFAEQPEAIQAMLMGHSPAEGPKRVATRILEQMAEGKARDGRG